MKETIIIVGASIAGLNAANTLVSNNYKGTIILIDKKDTYPYNPYPLSKEWMRNEDDTAPFLKETDFYECIDLRLGTNVVSFDPNNKSVTLDNGEVLHYDKLLIASGSSLRTLSMEHSDAEGIFYLRTYQDALAIKDYAKKVDDIVLIGGGFISLELASTFKQMGKNITILERSTYPLGKILGDEVAEYFMKMHREQGVRIETSVEIEGFGVDEHNTIEYVDTNHNETIKAQMIIIGVGVVPNVSFGKDSFELLNGAIIVNEFNETSIKDVYAAGDVVAWPYESKLIHIEHWENAFNQGVSVAKNMLNKHSNPFLTRPYFWSDQYDQTFEYLGHAQTWIKTVVRGSLDSRNFSVAYLDEHNKLLAILFANKFDKRKEVRQYMDKKLVFNADKFKDISLKLNEIE